MPDTEAHASCQAWQELCPPAKIPGTSQLYIPINWHLFTHKHCETFLCVTNKGIIVRKTTVQRRLTAIIFMLKSNRGRFPPFTRRTGHPSAHSDVFPLARVHKKRSFSIRILPNSYQKEAVLHNRSHLLLVIYNYYFTLFHIPSKVMPNSDKSRIFIWMVGNTLPNARTAKWCLWHFHFHC